MHFLVDYSSLIECRICDAPVEGLGYQFPISEAPELKPDLIEHGKLVDHIPCGIQCSCGSTQGMETLTLERLCTVIDLGN